MLKSSIGGADKWLMDRRFKWMLVRMALFGAEPFRFAAMIGMSLSSYLSFCLEKTY